MGLGLYIGSPLKAKRGDAEHSELFSQIVEAIEAAITDPLAKNMLAAGQRDGRLFVDLHPAEETVEFFVSEANDLVCSAKTSSAGPGYHAMLVDLLEHVGTTCGLAWEWDNQAKEYQDETGYRGTRDFAALQREMAGWLRAIAKMLLEDAERQQWQICLPLEAQVVGDYFAASPLGYWSREWFQGVATADDDEILRRGAEFFPWWNEGRGAEFWRNCGLVQCWSKLAWHSPDDETETQEYEATLQCFDRARSLDAAIRLPEEEIAEIRDLLEETAPRDEPPAADRIGFHRRLMRRTPFPGWSVDLPGYFFEEIEDDEGTLVYWFGPRTVRISTLTAEKKRPGLRPLESLLSDDEESEPEAPAKANFSKPEAPAKGDFLKPEAPAKGDFSKPEAPAKVPEERLLFQDADCIRRAKITWCEEGGDRYWMLHGETAAQSQTEAYFCVTTICYEDDADKQWAIDTWKSMSHAHDEES